ncbi:lysoplasmalogenase [Vibrio sp. ZSDE26]|uniref:Lysoplasmalogenase n=1 Tax=Vibrio amylolyticus TaxID=2847292 RepID=A0A9X1XMQ1_9VIBR|nr:lysoplasmalogenase [Vibrio amylolyticus]MCK6265742.1 lysoplasmalogenase [Vibrio amylolyticus]
MWSWVSVALAGFVSISANENSNSRQAMVFRAVSFAFLLVILYQQNTELSEVQFWVALGLGVSMIADTLYLLKKNGRLCFASFLIAQICLSKSFWVQLYGGIEWWLPAFLLAASVVAFFLLLPQIDRLIFPVTIMGLVLIQLAWAAGAVWLLESTALSLLGFIGSLMLIISAALLAIHDYRRPIIGGRYLISGAYLLAYSLITASAVV